MGAPWISLLVAVLLGTAHALPSHHVGRRWQHDSSHWVDIWTAMPQLTESANLPPPPFNSSSPPAEFVNSTIRQTIHLSLGSPTIRLRFSNAFGTTDLPITAVTIALPFNSSSGTPAVQPHTLKPVTFSGSPNFTIPSGGLVVSDPIDFPVEAQEIISVSMYLEQGQTTNFITSHPGSRATSWFSFGDYVDAENMTDSSTMSVAHWWVDLR